MEVTEHANVRESPDVVTQVVYQLRLRSDEANVVGKEKEDGGENGRAKAVHDSVGGARMVGEGVVGEVGHVCHIRTAKPEEGKRVG